MDKLGGKRVEKDSTNFGIPPSHQSFSAQATLRTRSLRKPTGRKSGGQQGHVGHELAKTASPSSQKSTGQRSAPIAEPSFLMAQGRSAT